MWNLKVIRYGMRMISEGARKDETGEVDRSQRIKGLENPQNTTHLQLQIMQRARPTNSK